MHVLADPIVQMFWLEIRFAMMRLILLTAITMEETVVDTMSTLGFALIVSVI